jgi:hypothetical protein
MLDCPWQSVSTKVDTYQSRAVRWRRAMPGEPQIVSRSSPPLVVNSRPLRTR